MLKKFGKSIRYKCLTYFLVNLVKVFGKFWCSCTENNTKKKNWKKFWRCREKIRDIVENFNEAYVIINLEKFQNN